MSRMQVTFRLKPQLSALAALDAVASPSRPLEVLNSPAVLTCGEPASSHPAGASQRGPLCPVGRLVDVRVAAWLWNPSRSGVSRDPDLAESWVIPSMTKL